MVAEELREAVDAHNEWLLVRGSGRSFPLLAAEIEIDADGARALFGFPDDIGFHTWRLNGFTAEGGELAVDVAGAFGRGQEVLRLVPRTPASELTAAAELARMQNANQIAQLIHDNFPGVELERVALNETNGRIAQITFTRDKKHLAAISDVTAKLTPETLIAHAMLWHERLGIRKKKPILDVWIIAEKRRSRDLQKLHALLSGRWKSVIRIVEISRKSDPPTLAELPGRRLGDLWRERARKVVLPADSRPSKTAAGIMELAPNEIDIVYTRQGETLRYLGLPFARVRSVMGREKAWFGVGRGTRMLIDENWDDLRALVETLKIHRSADSENKRHEQYRAASEAWLESILSGNINLLDANLILAPLYNQFRSMNDRVDLLALRKDGRLVIIELKTQPDREMVLQAADYWRKIELQRRRGVLADANLFGGLEIADQPAVVYLAAPALSFHYHFELFAASLDPAIEIWRFELHQKWRSVFRVIARVGRRE
jgi:hypothetical protein